MNVIGLGSVLPGNPFPLEWMEQFDHTHSCASEGLELIELRELLLQVPRRAWRIVEGGGSRMGQMGYKHNRN